MEAIGGAQPQSGEHRTGPVIHKGETEAASMSLRTPLCHTLGIDLPIWNAGMGGGNTGPELAAAVSNAGGLGVLGMGGVPAPFVREAIRETRRRTQKPFGVNVILALLQEGQIETVLEEKVPLLVLFWGDAKPFVDEAHRRGTKVALQVGSVDEAKSAAAAGVDAVIVQGFEAGGHVRGTVGLAALLPAVVDAVKPVPVVASGGIANGRGLAAALDLGADAVSIGTRFVCSEESRASRAYKERIVRSRAEDTVHTMLFDVGWPNAAHRVLRSKAVEEWEAAGRPASGRRPGEGQVVGKFSMGGEEVPSVRYSIFNPMEGFEGDMEYVALYAGQSCSLVNDVRPAAEIVETIAKEAAAVRARSS
jgi:nitronate monooxygenase/enoyl-[acyl-carrier protein] reductase II